MYLNFESVDFCKKKIIKLEIFREIQKVVPIAKTERYEKIIEVIVKIALYSSL
ncbi:MAG: hypothetical protein Fur0024_1370 [Patescibacteria group bacterium]